MAKRTGRPDANQIAARILGQATGQIPKEAKESSAAERGRKGGLKGGAARAKALPAEKRKAIAKKAAAKRWNKPN